MHRIGFPEMMIVGAIVLLLFTMYRKPPRPRKPPQHPLPSHEPLHLFLRIKRRSEGSWHF